MFLAASLKIVKKKKKKKKKGYQDGKGVGQIGRVGLMGKKF